MASIDHRAPHDIPGTSEWIAEHRRQYHAALWDLIEQTILVRFMPRDPLFSERLLGSTALQRPA